MMIKKIALGAAAVAGIAGLCSPALAGSEVSGAAVFATSSSFTDLGNFTEEFSSLSGYALSVANDDALWNSAVLDVGVIELFEYIDQTTFTSEADIAAFLTEFGLSAPGLEEYFEELFLTDDSYLAGDQICRSGPGPDEACVAIQPAVVATILEGFVFIEPTLTGFLKFPAETPDVSDPDAFGFTGIPVELLEEVAPFAP